MAATGAAAISSTFSTNLGLEIPGHGDFPNTWDTPADANYNVLDTFAGGTLTLPITGGTTNLTVAQARNSAFVFTGSLSSNQFVNFPAIGGGRKTILMQASLGAFSLFLRGNAGVDTIGVWFTATWNIPVGILVSPNRVYWAGYESEPPGSIKDFPLNSAIPGFVIADGRFLSTTTYDLLYSVYQNTFGAGSGTFKIPDLRGVATVGADNMGTGSRGVLNNLGVNVFTGEASHLLAVTEMPSHTHAATPHTHGLSDPGHRHSVPLAQSASGGTGGQTGGYVSGSTGSSTTGVAIQSTTATVANTGGGGSHNNIQPSQTVMKYIRF